MTRPEGQEEELIRGLVALRHDVVHCPLLEVEPLGDEPVDVTGYDWVIVTSVNGARELRRRMTGTPARVAAIGRATADAFGGADLVPAVSTQEGLLAELPARRVACSSPAPKERAGSSSRSSAPTSCRSTGRAS